jgi:hypothetical protein
VGALAEATAASIDCTPPVVWLFLGLFFTKNELCPSTAVAEIITRMGDQNIAHVLRIVHKAPHHTPGVGFDAGGGEDLVGVIRVDFQNPAGRNARGDGGGQQRARRGAGAIIDVIAREAAELGFQFDQAATGDDPLMPPPRIDRTLRIFPPLEPIMKRRCPLQVLCRLRCWRR